MDPQELQEPTTVNLQNKVCGNCNHCEKPMLAGEHLYITQGKKHVCLKCAIRIGEKRYGL